jgi:hypothetical protein
MVHRCSNSLTHVDVPSSAAFLNRRQGIAGLVGVWLTVMARLTAAPERVQT